VLGRRELDLLGATDYLFPRGMDHHRLFAGVRGVSPLVQAFARRVSGLGRLPDEVLDERSAERREVPVLIVGGGAAGLAAAAVLGKAALLCDDQAELGGALGLLEPEAAAAAIARARASGAELRQHTTAAGLFRDENGLAALLVGDQGPLFVRPKQVLVATGNHDPSPLFENNDAPGVLSARAALLALRRGVAVGQRVAVVGAGRFARRFVELARGRLECIELEPETVVRALGRTELSRVLVRAAGAERRIRADALIFDGPAPPPSSSACRPAPESASTPLAATCPSAPPTATSLLESTPPAAWSSPPTAPPMPNASPRPCPRFDFGNTP
jgi:sarcosine oxidase subunit alpha